MSDYGHRLIIPIIEQKAAQIPNGLYCTLPQSSTSLPSDPINITWRDLNRSIDKAAWWLDSQLGNTEPGQFPTIAFIGLNGPLYFVLAMACIKTGRKLLLNSPRNSVDAQLHLFDATGCTVLLRGPRGNLVKGILEARPMRCIITPALTELLKNDDDVKRYPYDKTWEQAKDDPIIVLHSSGSTGPPKPIVLRNTSMATMDAHHLIGDVGGKRDVFRMAEGSTMFVPMPCFHASGVIWNFFSAVYFDIRVVYPPVGEPLNVGLVEKLLDQMDFDSMFVPPSIVEDMARGEKILPKLEKLRYVMYAGGPLSQDLGNVIARHTPVLTFFGTTEFAIPPIIFFPMNEDWNWFLVPPEMKGIDMRPREEDELAEMVMVRDAYTDKFHSTFITFPDVAEYRTKDLFVQNPHEPNMWQYRARSDDVLVLSNGEKVVPIPMEGQLSKCPHISGALILGHGRFETAALIELSEESRKIHSHAEKLAAVTPFIEKANNIAPSYARLSRDRVLFTSPDKPMIRAGKGTVIRKATLALYEREINGLYDGLASMTASSALALHLDATDTAETEAELQDIFSNITCKQKDAFGPDDDFFTAVGLDSLHVLNVIRQIKAQLNGEHAQLSPNKVSPSLVYTNPTVRKLARALHDAATGGGQDGMRSTADERAKALEELYLRYTRDLPHRALDSPSSSPPTDHEDDDDDDAPISVVLTGSTGSLGSYILAALLAHPRVAHVYCLNRGAPSTAAQKQRDWYESRGLPAAAGLDDGRRVTFLQANPGADRHGLSADRHAELARYAACIIHNAWAVDFNMALPSFAPHVKGVRNLVDLAFAAGLTRRGRAPPILFTSTIDTVRNWRDDDDDDDGVPVVPEAAVHDLSVPGSGGYGESKHVGERLLEAAARVTGVPACVCRAGQITGPVRSTRGGKWNEREWFPSLVKSSVRLGALPHSVAGQDRADWVPVDVLADVVVELMFDHLRRLRAGGKEEEELVQFNHLVNPRPSSYPAVILPALVRRLGIPVVTYDEWLRKLQDEAARPDADPDRCPGIKLLDFFERMGEDVKAMEREGTAGVILDTKLTVERSKTLKVLEPVGAEWVDVWCQGWRL